MNQHLQSDLRRLISEQSRQIRSLESRINSQTARLRAADRGIIHATARMKAMESEIESMRAAVLEISKRQRGGRMERAA